MLRLFTRDSMILLILCLVILASAGDLVADLMHGANTAHLIQEAVILTLAILMLAWMLQSIRLQSQEIASLHRQLEEARHLPLPEHGSLVDARKHLSEIILSQFADWGLSRSEQEVGQFILKGLTLKEIAMIRGTAEKTIRQQASSIYQKAGVSGRHAFSAWFIEDFL